VIDIAPTILEVAGIPEPGEVNGVPQTPIEGISMAYTFGDEAAPGRRITQYFEMLGNRALSRRLVRRMSARPIAVAVRSRTVDTVKLLGAAGACRRWRRSPSRPVRAQWPR
jgi:arylsulfatase A-like enzyme